MELVTDILAIVAGIIFLNSVFAFFAYVEFETGSAKYRRKRDSFFYFTLSLGLIAASLVLG